MRFARNTISRLRVLLTISVLAFALSLVIPTAANAATHGGNFSLTAGIFGGVYNTPQYSTSQKASGCVDVTSFSGAGHWNFQLFVNGSGVWISSNYSGKAKVCSPTKDVSRGSKISLHIVATAEYVTVSIDGPWTINTS
jgi:hypothetical protein